MTRVVLQSLSEWELSAANNFQIKAGDTNVVLALITFEGLKQGLTLIVVSDDTLFGIQDQNSNIITVSTSSGQLTVP